MKSGLFLDSLWQDIRFGVRTLTKTPALTLIAVFSLAIGIGVNASLFSLVDRLVLTTLAVRDPEGLFIIYSNNRTGLTDRALVSRPRTYSQLVRHLRRRTSAAWRWRTSQIPVAESSAGTLGDRDGQLFRRSWTSPRARSPDHGRGRSAQDQNSPSSWAIASGKMALGGDPGALGRTLRLGPAMEPVELGPASFRVVGVAPPEFHGAAIGEPIDLFLPVQALPAMYPWAAQMLKQPNASPFNLMARLKPGVTLERAQAEVWNRFPNFDMVARGSSPDRRPRRRWTYPEAAPARWTVRILRQSATNTPTRLCC